MTILPAELILYMPPLVVILHSNVIGSKRRGLVIFTIEVGDSLHSRNPKIRYNVLIPLSFSLVFDSSCIISSLLFKSAEEYNVCNAESLCFLPLFSTGKS